MRSRTLTYALLAMLVLATAPLAGSQPADQGNRGRGESGKPAPAEKKQPPGQQRRREAPPAQSTPATRPAPSPGRGQPQTRPSRSRPSRPVDTVLDRRITAPRQVVRAAQPTWRPTPTSRPSTIAQQRTFWPQYTARDWRSQHRTWVQRGGYRGYRIPVDRYRLYFGRRHRYHLSSFTIRVYQDEPQFYTNGYWFTLLDPIPQYWPDDWYDSDYVTIVLLDDGYYLLNEAYPGDLLALDIELG